MPTLLTKAEAGKLLRISSPTLTRLVKGGRLKCIRLGKKIFFAESDLIEALNAMKA